MSRQALQLPLLVLGRWLGSNTYFIYWDWGWMGDGFIARGMDCRGGVPSSRHYLGSSAI